MLANEVDSAGTAGNELRGATTVLFGEALAELLPSFLLRLKTSCCIEDVKVSDDRDRFVHSTAGHIETEKVR